MRYIFLTISLVVLLLSSANAQTKTTVDVQQMWAGYFNQTRLTDKWGLWADAHLRTKDNFFDNLSLGMVRLGLTYYLNNDTKLTAGYAYVNHFPSDNHKYISQPEHRPWQQMQWHTKYPKMKLMQWFRLEERFRRKIEDDYNLADDYNFNFRVRYNILSQFALSKQAFKAGSCSFVLSNEVFVNFGKEIVYNAYDQNRFFAGFHYHVNKHSNLQLGYMNVYQQLPVGNKYRSVHAARLFYFHQLDLRKKTIHE